jgi:hypothetical protein
MPRGTKLIPEGYESVEAVAVERPTVRTADRTALCTALRDWLAGVPRYWDDAVLYAQQVLADRGVRLTNDEVAAVVAEIEAAWHPGGVPAEATTAEAGALVGGPR